MKSAPNVKLLPKNKYTEAIIFAGADAWAHAKEWNEDFGKKIADDDTPPIILGPKDLAALDSLRIIDKNRRSVRIYKAGEISEIHLSKIQAALAVAGAKEVRLFDGMFQQEPSENWSTRLDSLREEIKNGVSVVDNYRQANGITADELAPRVESRPDGLYWVTPKVDGQSGEVLLPGHRLCDQMEVLGEGKDQESGAIFIALRWNHRGEKVTRHIRAGMIGERDGWEVMKDNGLGVTSTPSLRAKLADWIQIEARKGAQYRATPRSGWFGDVYIMPNGDVIGDPDAPIMFTGGSSSRNAYTVKGTPESWRDNVASLGYKNPFQMLAVATALSAPLIGVIGADGFGIHLYEESTAGKTTAEDLGTSLYGLPKPQRLSWFATALGIANEAESHNHGLLALDEIEQASSARSVFTSAYTLFNGKGKLQGDPNGGNRELKYFETVVISTGEKSVEAFLAGAKIKVKAGQLVRLLNIPVTRPEEFHGHKNGKKHADALKAAWIENHGAAGREWIRWLSENKDASRKAYIEASQRWDDLIPEEYGEQVHRVKDRFAVLESALILSQHITGWDAQACRDALQHVFNAWVKEFGTGNREHEQVIEQAKSFLIANSLDRFIPVDFDELSRISVHNLAGYTDKGTPGEGEPMTFYVLPDPFKNEVASGFDSNKAAAILHKFGLIRRPKSGEGWQVKTPRIKHLNNKQVRAYALLLVDEN